MHNNGVSHKTEPRDLDGVYTILKWLSYIPKTKSSPVPMIKPSDPVDREVDYMPTKVPYDPRWMLSGRQSPSEFLDYTFFCTALNCLIPAKKSNAIDFFLLNKVVYF